MYKLQTQLDHRLKIQKICFDKHIRLYVIRFLFVNVIYSSR